MSIDIRELLKHLICSKAQSGLAGGRNQREWSMMRLYNDNYLMEYLRWSRLFVTAFHVLSKQALTHLYYLRFRNLIVCCFTMSSSNCWLIRTTSSSVKFCFSLTTSINLFLRLFICSLIINMVSPHVHSTMIVSTGKYNVRFNIFHIIG